MSEGDCCCGKGRVKEKVKGTYVMAVWLRGRLRVWVENYSRKGGWKRNGGGEGR